VLQGQILVQDSKEELLGAVSSLEVDRQTIDDWRRHYNTERPHSTLNYMTPAAYAKTAA